MDNDSQLACGVQRATAWHTLLAHEDAPGLYGPIWRAD
jgi:hypothetical protein